jgi:hypothetical protein
MNIRFEEIKSKIQSLEGQMGVKKRVHLGFCEFNESPCAIFPTNIVKIPAWFLFKYDDIPQRFQIATMDDPRLTDPRFLNEFSDWMNEKLFEAGLSSVVRPIHHGVLQIVIKLMHDPDLYEKSKDFVLGHELAHLDHDQTQLQASLSLLGITGGIFLFSLALAIIPFVQLTISVTVIAVAVIVSISSVLGWMNKGGLPVSLPSVEEEKKCDLDSVKALQDANGGIYWFETYRRHNLAFRRQNSASAQDIDAWGNDLNDKKHPPWTERIAYLREWQSQHPQRV